MDDGFDPGAQKEPYGLTTREWQVLTLTCDGATTAQIAHGFGLSSDTVSQHLSQIRGKLRVSNRTEMTAVSLREELVPVEDGRRPGAIEVAWSPGGEPEDLTWRYFPAEGRRRRPKTVNGFVDTPLSDVLGPGWRDQFGPLAEAVVEARDTNSSGRFGGLMVPDLDRGELFEWSGEVYPIGDSHFLTMSNVFPQ